jgi:hypothetical protein
MTIESIPNQPNYNAEKPPVSVQNELQKDVLKEASGQNTNSMQKQLLQMLASQQPQQSVQQTAQNQLKEYGRVDVKV